MPSIFAAVDRLKAEVQKALELAVASEQYSDTAQLAALALHLDRCPGVPSQKKKTAPVARMMGIGSFPKSPEKAAVTSAATPASEYPRFRSLDGSLVKVGWSPKVASEYRHTVEGNALKHVLGCVAAVGKSAKVFRSADVNRAHLACCREGTSAIPDYQINATLTWLQSVGLVVKRGRSGYVLGNPRTFLSAANTALSMLPTDDCTTQNKEGS